MFLVTWGYDDPGMTQEMLSKKPWSRRKREYFLDSTEVYDPSVGSWVTTGAKLPRPMIDMRAVNIEDRVLIFGRFLKNLIGCLKNKDH